MCDKKSCEACTEKVDKFNSVNALPLEAAFFMFSDYSNPMAMLNFFFIKHSKTECTVRSFGLTSTCYFETSSVQGVHHAGVAVELGHMLKNIKLVMVFLYMLLYNFTIYYTILAECIWIPLLKLFKGLHHAGVAVKVEHFEVKCKDKIIFSLASCQDQDLAECNRINLRLVSGSTVTSLAKVLHHAGVAAMLSSEELAIEWADEEDDLGDLEALQEDAEPKLLFVVGVLQLYEDEYLVWVLSSRIFPTEPCGS